MQRGTLVLSALWLMGAAQADPSPNQGLTGDWGGARTRWYERGVDLQLSYFAEPAYNAAGGAAQLLRSADQFIAGATLDLEKLWGVPQAKVQITFTDRNGNNLSADAQLGTLLQVQQVYGRGNILRLTELSYDQLFFDGVLDVKLGRLGVGGSFYVWSCQFMNLSFCGELPGNIVSTWYNWPVSQWGARTRLRITQELKFEVGVYEVNPSYLENRNGTALNPSGKIGELVPFELDWTPHWGAARLAGTVPVRGLVRQLGPAGRVLGAKLPAAGPQSGCAATGARPRERRLREHPAADHANGRQQRARPERVLQLRRRR